MSFIIESLRPTDWEQVRRIYLEGLATGQASFETGGFRGCSRTTGINSHVSRYPATTSGKYDEGMLDEDPRG